MTFFNKSFKRKKIALLSFFLTCLFNGIAQNAIVTENALPGNPSSEWDISGAGDLSIQGFATDISVNKGNTVHFKIKTDAPAYTITIYRIGYYQGNGARMMGTAVITATLPQTQPAELNDTSTGLIDCGNWNESAHWNIPASAVSGVYIAKLTRTDDGGSSHIIFIVRDDASTSDLYFQTADATWQAYNVYGGNSLYVGSTSYPSGHATKVSYNRPFITRNGGGGGGAEEDWIFNAEYPMIRWLERNGYDVSYTTCVDADRNGALIQNHKSFLSVGHDEYWSAAQRNYVEAARSAGVHLAFFSGNEIYWKTRWENSTDGTNTPYRTLVCYKEGSLGENSCGGKCDPLPNVWTGLWREGCSFPATDGCDPENSLSGQISWDGTQGAIEVPASYGQLRFWRNTPVALLAAEQTQQLSDGTLGYEWDWEQYRSSSAAGRIKLSSTFLNSRFHHLSMYRAASGALVFGAGTVQWSWGLDGNHDRGGSDEDPVIQQATVNLFADMHIQPGLLQAGLVATTASTDITPPLSVITAPANGTMLPNGSSVTISGTASDNAVVGGVEVSTDGGTTWASATGTTAWTYEWTPTTMGPVVIKSRAIDDSGIIEAAGTFPAANVIIDTVGTSLPVVCPCSVFSPSDIPAIPVTNDGQAIETGVKFKVSENGYITALRFYKGAGGTGLHRAHIWHGTTLLAEQIFTSETSSGWQEVPFANPVAVTAGITYVASCHSSSGDYAYTDLFFTSALINGPVRFLADGEDGTNGVYTYSPVTAYPSSSFQASNYWVDIIFNNTVGPDTIPPVVLSTLPVSGATGVNINSAVTASFSEAIDVATLNSLSFQLLNGASPVAATITYDTITHVARLAYTAPLNYSTTYTVVVKGGTGYQRIKDLTGNAMASDHTWQFTTVAPPAPLSSEGPGGPILVISSVTNPFSRYTVEILRAEGFNEFYAMDIDSVTPSILASYDVALLGEFALSAANVTVITNWVNAGGTLIAMRPDLQLSSLLGITSAAGTMQDKYLLINNTGAGAGIVNQTMQYHGTADLYTLSGASALAALYSSAGTSTIYPAVTSKNVGSNGGKAIAFTFDLARSIVYTRQGNPAWAGQKRDGQIAPIRSDDQFFPDWLDLSKVAIPQADEQQHFLSNLITKSNLHHKPLPKFWFLPKGLEAAIVMTGDDHGDAGMQPRFDINITESTAGCSVEDWDCIRSTGYMYTGAAFTDSMAAYYDSLGFEVALHVNTNCDNYTAPVYQNYISSQMALFSSTFPSIDLPSTNRNHCIAWSDWSVTPEVEAANGIRMDLNYYYWPDSWVNNQSGMFTGSGMPMRFAKMDGTIIDCYQTVTQMPDESGESFPEFCDSLLNRATDHRGYYGVFATNMHFDNPDHAGANQVVASAQAHNIPVVSAKQMLKWLDGRNNSSFGAISWNTDTLKFTVTAASGSRNIQAMVPAQSASGYLTAITLNNTPVSYVIKTIKGMEYAFISAPSGSYAAIYSASTLTISALTASPVTANAATITWNTNQPANSKVVYGISAAALNMTASNAAFVSAHSLTLTGLSPATTYYYRAVSQNAANDSVAEPALLLPPASFTTTGNICTQDVALADFNLGTADTNTYISNETDGEIILKPAFNDEFNGTSVSGNWTSGNWNAGGTQTVSGGSLTVDGGFAATNTYFSPGSSVEFVATFSSSTFQNIGFATDAAFSAPWITIGQGNSAGTLYARSDGGTTVPLGSGLIGTPHRYRIEWKPASFVFYVDDVQLATINQTITGNMVVINSDFNTGSGALQADWIRVTPYAGSGTYTSRIFDHGISTNWNSVNWTATTPSGTSLAILVRTGNTALPDGTWSAFIPVTNGGVIGSSSRYLQYRADLASTDSTITPVLNDLEIFCNDSVTCIPPTASISAVDPSACLGNSIALQLNSASGAAPYTLVVNGTTYSNVNPGTVFATVPPQENSIWGSVGLPANANVTDGVPIETGTKFRASANGYITGIRFYKGNTNTGTHTASLWTKSGRLLASAPFTSETVSGWQEVHFSNPVYIKADTTYIASYFSPGGVFAITASFFASTGVSNPPLTALQAGVDGPNGVYMYGGGFPANGNTANYWVDVLFVQEITTPQAAVYVLTEITDNNGCSNSGMPDTVTATITPVPNGAITATGNSCTGEPVQLVFNATAGTGPFNLQINDSVYSGVMNGIPFNAGTISLSGAQNIWSNSIVPGTPAVTVDSAAIELGVKFRSTQAGKIKGIRFYKGNGNTGTHTGSLWNASGSLLATATFTSETSAGWQQVLFSSPVSIAANTTYIASYFAPFGRYAYDNSYFAASGVTNAPLKALQNGEDGTNGVYSYSSGGVAPSNSFAASNYWVDVIYSPNDSSEFVLQQITNANNCNWINSGNSIRVQQHPAAESTANVSICSTDSIMLGGRYRHLAGTYYDTLNTVYGCDSIITTTLTINPSFNNAETVNICSGSNYTFPDGTVQTNITATVTHASSFTSHTGCDSVITTTLNVNPVFNQSVTATVCSGSNYTFPDGTTQTNITAAVTHASTFTGYTGCDSVITTTVNVNPVFNQAVTATVCSGSNYTFPDGTTQTNITAAVTHASTFTGYTGCDSVITTTVNVNPVFNQSVTATVCSGSSYTFPDGTTQTNITAAVTHASTFTGYTGCDSVITTTLNVNPIFNQAVTATVCSGSNYTFPDGTVHTNITSTLAYTSYLHSISGCDSIIQVTVSTYPQNNQVIPVAVCSGSSYTFPDGSSITNITAPYNHSSIFTGANGCDSTIVTDISVNALPVVTAHASVLQVCEGESITFTGSGAVSYTWSSGVTNGVLFYPATSQTYTVTGTAINSCTDTASIYIPVHSMPVIQFDTLGFADTVCLDAGFLNFGSASPAGGIYSGPGVSGTGFDPFVAGLGTHMITYTISDTNLCTNSAGHMITVIVCGTGINEFTGSKLSVYPNPASDAITINYKAALGELKIWDIAGQLVYESVSSEKQKTIDISSFNAGIYTLYVQGKFIKIVKN